MRMLPRTWMRDTGLGRVNGWCVCSATHAIKSIPKFNNYLLNGEAGLVGLLSSPQLEHISTWTVPRIIGIWKSHSWLLGEPRESLATSRLRRPLVPWALTAAQQFRLHREIDISRLIDLLDSVKILHLAGHLDGVVRPEVEADIVDGIVYESMKKIING